MAKACWNAIAVRVVCALGVLASLYFIVPPAVAQEVGARLRSDASRKVREMAAARLGG